MKKVLEMSKIGRNNICPCGSGKKFKNCCMDTYNEKKSELIEKAKENISKLWSGEEISKMTNDEIFQKLGSLGIAMDENKFIEYSMKEISSEKLAKFIENEAGFEIEGRDRDFPWLAMGILWKRITPDRPCIETIYSNIYDGYDYFETGDMDDAMELWSTAWNDIVKLFSPITREYEYINNQYEGFDIDIFEWTDDFIELYDSFIEEDKTFTDKKMKFLNEFIKSFPETRNDLIIDVKLNIAICLFDSGKPAAAETEFENIARIYPHNSKVYQIWANSYTIDCISKNIRADLKKAEAIIEKGLFTGVDDSSTLLDELTNIREERLEEEPENAAKFSIELENAEKWQENFKYYSVDDKIKLLSEASNSGKINEMIHYIEIEYDFIKTVELAVNSGRHSELFEFFNELAENRRELYLIFSEIIDNFLASYYIYKDEFDRALSVTARFCLDFYLNRVIFEKFVERFLLQKKAGNALALIDRIIEKHWVSLDDDCRFKIALILFYCDLQNEYIWLKQGNVPRQLKNFKNFELYGKVLDNQKMGKELEIFYKSCQNPDIINELCANLEKKNKFQRESFFESITSSFAAFSFEKYGIDFPVSYILWSNFIEFIEARFENSYNEMPPDKLFNFSSDYLKKKVKTSAENIIYPFEDIAPVMAGGALAFEYLFKTGTINDVLYNRMTGVFKDIHKYARTKYQEKIWALKLFNI